MSDLTLDQYVKTLEESNTFLMKQLETYRTYHHEPELRKLIKMIIEEMKNEVEHDK